VFSRFENGNGLGSSLYRMPATGGAATLVIAGLPLVKDTNFTTPAWSPDGTKIAYAGMDDDEGWGNLWTITPDGKNNTQLTLGTMTDVTPDWSVA
jgi:Tol biopolymer transport system component